MTTNQGFPIPHSPISDPNSGMINPTWLRFFLSLWNRTGGAITKLVSSVGITSGDLDISNSPITSSGDINLSLKDINSSFGTYGDSINSVQITVNEKGLTTSVVDVPISFPNFDSSKALALVSIRL